MKLKVEVWKSDQSQEEIHLFVEGERNDYVLGFNPKVIAVEEVRSFLADKGFHFDLP